MLSEPRASRTLSWGKVPATVQPLCQRPHVPDQLPLSASLLKGRVYPSPSLDPTCLGCPEGSGLCETIMVIGRGGWGVSFQHFSLCPKTLLLLQEFSTLFLFTLPPILLPSPQQRVIPQCVPYVSVLTKGHSCLVSAALIEITLSHFFFHSPLPVG